MGKLILSVHVFGVRQVATQTRDLSFEVCTLKPANRPSSINDLGVASSRRARSTGTRTDILVAAERLFAERGFDSVSLREIAPAAGQRNHSAVQYHFGDRATLLHDLFEFRLSALDVRRRQLLDMVRFTDNEASIRALVTAFVLPLAEVADGSTWYVRFLARFLTWDYRNEVMPLFVDDAERTASETKRLIQGCLSTLPDWLRCLRVEQMERYIVTMLAYAEGERSRGIDLGAPYKVWLDDLIQTAVAMLTCPTAHKPPVERASGDTKAK